MGCAALGHPKQCLSIPAAVPAGVTSASPAGRNHANAAADGTGGDGPPRRGIPGFVGSVGRRGGQRAGVTERIAATIPARTSGARLAHAATRRARSASGGALPVGPRPAPRFGSGAARAAPGAARPSESAYSPGDSASARGFESPRLHFHRACAFGAFAHADRLVLAVRIRWTTFIQLAQPLREYG